MEAEEIELTVRPATASQMLDVSVRTLARWRDSGDGPPYIMQGAGSAILYPVDELKAWVKNEAQS